MKINHGKPHENEVGRFPQGEHPQTLPSSNTCRANMKRDWILQMDTTLFCQLEKHFPFPLRNSSANEKPPYLELLAYFKGLSVQNNLPNLPLFSLKKKKKSPFALFSGLAYGLPQPDCNSLLFLSKPIFCW